MIESRTNLQFWKNPQKALEELLDRKNSRFVHFGDTVKSTFVEKDAV